MNSPASIWKRIGWLVLIWAASVACLGTMAGLLRWWLTA